MSASQNGTPSAQPEPATPAWQRVPLRQIALGTALVALIVCGCVLVLALRSVFLLLFLGIVLATALSPLFERLRAAGLSRNLAAITTFLLLLTFLGGVLALIIPFFVAQLGAAATSLPQRYASFLDMLAHAPFRLVRDLRPLLPNDPFVPMQGDGALSPDMGEALPPLLRGLASGALVLLLSFYWLSYRALAIQSVALLIPLNLRTQATEIWNEIEAKIGAFVRGLAILSISIAVLSFAGYSLIGLPGALTIALIAGLLEAVPYVGALVTMVIAAMVGLAISPEKALLAVVVANIVQAIEGSIVVPRAMDRTVGVNPVVTLLALALFGELFGLVGALLAVPLAAALQVLLDRFVLRGPAPESMEIGGRDQLALLRYRAQDLASDLRQQVRSKGAEITPEADAGEEELESILTDLDSVLSAAQEQTP
ncbi:AI-2E family transporter [Chloroflexia bacterium SDU3-3]|nr:AI-2E family transporter [Chloroflexia bacterium SDU3-3]